MLTVQALSKKHQKELMNRDQEIQQLTSHLGKKDLELQALESRMNAAEEQQREALQTMRKMLAEKDKTIEVGGLSTTLLGVCGDCDVRITTHKTLSAMHRLLPVKHNERIKRESAGENCF